MLSYFKRIFSLDYRSLAIMRMFIGLTLLADIIQRTRSLTAHYADAGVLPRSGLLSIWNESGFWSIYFLNGSPLFVAIIFFVTAVFAVMMIVGYKTRIATIASFFLLISLHVRNPIVLQGGDVALRVILFFMMFLPLGQRMSVDTIVGEAKYPKEKEYFSPASIAYVIQFLIIWTMSGFLKTGAPWVTNATAVAMALHLESFVTNFGMWLRSIDSAMYFITTATLIIERYVFVLFITPVQRDMGRLAGLILTTTLIIGFNLSFRLGLFGMIMFSISLGLLPGYFWDHIIMPLRKIASSKSQKGMTIFYDGDCSFCSRISKVTAGMLLLHPETKIIFSGSDPEAYSTMHSAHSWVVRDHNGVSYTGFRAFVALMQSAFFYRIFAPVFLLTPIMYIGENIYRMVAHNRPMTCSVDMPDKPIKKQNKRIKNIFIIVMLGFVVVWNISSLPSYSRYKKPKFIEKSLLIFRLDQKWNMFAPYPTTEDGFFVMPGVLRDGSSVDIYSGSTNISYLKPQNMAWIYQNQRWQKYLMNLWLKDFSNYRLGYGQYLCREWNAHNIHEKNLMTFEILYILEETDINTLKESEPVPVSIWQHQCFSDS